MPFLKPDLIVESLRDIDIANCYAIGIRCFLIDLDNTITPWHSLEISGAAKELIRKSKEAGITAVLFSNATEERTREAAWNAGISYYAAAKKPFPYRYRQVMHDLSYSAQEIMMIGDQLFTDVLGGNLSGCRTVLVSPLTKREFVGTRLLRLLERHLAGRRAGLLDRIKPGKVKRTERD